MDTALKNDIVAKLQQEILSMQGLREPAWQRNHIRFGAIEQAFPNNIFPTGAIHEFLSNAKESAAATTGFMAGLLGGLMQKGGPCLWISSNRNIFPPALKLFGIEPERIIFIDIQNEADVLWAIEEALKCEALSAVVGELKEISFTQSRRLQLAVEQSHVTGLMHCYQANKIGNTTCIARWKVTPLASTTQDGLPGLGYPHWNVELIKVRNGKPQAWQIQWQSGSFAYPAATLTAEHNHLPKTA